jgi:DHA1 family multidrug resistance protein-like MFS transporter
MIAFAFSFGGSVISPILPLYVESFGVSLTTVGLFFSAYSTTWSLLQLYTGHLADRYGRKRLLVIGLLIYGVFALACGLARNFPQLVLFRVLQGVGLGLYCPAGLALAAEYEERGRSMAFYRSAQAAAVIVAPTLGGYIGEIGLGYPFFTAALMVLVGLAASFFIREAERKTRAVTFFASLLRALEQRSFLLLCLGAFMAELCFAGLGIAIPLAGDDRGYSTETIGLMFSLYFLVFTILQPLIGVLSERVDRKPLLVLASLVATLGFLELFGSAKAEGMVLSMGLLGAGLGAIFVQSGAWVAEIAPLEEKGLYMATFDGVIDLSFIIMPALVGLLVAQKIDLPFLLCALLTMMAGGVFLLIRPERRGA